MAAISVMSAHLVSMTDDTLVRANMAALADSAVEQLVCCYQLTSYTPANQSAIIRVSAVTPVRSFQIKKPSGRWLVSNIVTLASLPARLHPAPTHAGSRASIHLEMYWV